MYWYVRKVQLGDEEILAQIQTESWKAAFSDFLDEGTLQRCTQIEKAEAMYRKLLENGTGNGYLLFADGVPHCIAWWDSARDTKFSGKAELICIHSLPDRWRYGLGSAMMNRILSDVMAEKYSSIVLWVFEQNYRARAFYEAHGFCPNGHTQMAFGITEMCYEKIL